MIYNQLRNSNIELLRLVLMVMIIMHHIVTQVFSPHFSNRYWGTFDTFLHTGVIVFILISGYYGIHFKKEKILKLICEIIFYGVTLGWVAYLFVGGRFLIIIKSFFLFSNGFYWFVACYLQLYLLAPLLNNGLASMKKKHYLLTIMSLVFIVNYLGCIRNVVTVGNGKDLLSFIYFYVIGNAIHKFGLAVNSMFYRFLFFAVFFVFVALLLVPYDMFLVLENYIYRYNSPILMLFSIFLFLSFLRCSYQNNLINWLAASSFSIYLIHEHPLLREYIYIMPFRFVQENFSNMEFPLLVLGAIIISILCIMLDKGRIFCFKILKIDKMCRLISKKI